MPTARQTISRAKCGICCIGCAGRSWWRATRSAASSAQPAGPSAPEPWILGSSDYGAQVAAYFGLPFCFAAFITDGRGAAEALASYRAQFRPSAEFPTPTAALCVWAMAAETEEAVRWQFASRAVWRLGRDRGVYAPLPSPEEAAATVLSDDDRERVRRLRSRAIAGTGSEVAERLLALADEHEVDEIVILTTLHDPAARRRSYTLIAEALAGVQVPLPADGLPVPVFDHAPGRDAGQYQHGQHQRE